MQAVNPLRLATALLAVAALSAAVILATSDASAKPHPRGDTARIEMKFDGKHAPFFKGDDTIEAGGKLTIVNKSNPQEIGPHTFSVVTQDALKEIHVNKAKCAHLKLKVCKNVAKAHQIDFQEETVGKPDVDNGKKGWDAGFSDTEKKGDTWFSFNKNDKTSRKVKLDAGSKLYYFCFIHPEMEGKIKVVK